MPLKKELQKQCKDAGIGVGGTINDLKDRLEAYQKYEEALLGDPEELCDAILVSRTTAGGSEEKVTKEAKYAFERTLEDPDEALEVTQIRGEFYVGNRRGVSLGERPSELGEKDISKDAKIASLDAKIALLDAKVASLEKRDDLLAEEMLLLKAESKDYRRVRSRFISTFVRDKLKNQTPIDEMIIHEGNCTAHRGDAAVDALLYDGAEGAKRDDEYAFEVLYGLYPSDVKKITHKETLEILNLHASVQANKDRIGSDEFYEKFGQFINALKWSRLNEDYLTIRPENATLTAYKALRKCKLYV